MQRVAVQRDAYHFTPVGQANRVDFIRETTRMEGCTRYSN
jgi:hypothetical protein